MRAFELKGERERDGWIGWRLREVIINICCINPHTLLDHLNKYDNLMAHKVLHKCDNSMQVEEEEVSACPIGVMQDDVCNSV